MRSDRIRLSGVRAQGHHGVFGFEKRDGQVFVVDVELTADLSWAGASDALTDTVNYGEIGAAVVARIEGPSFDLIERLAEVIAGDVLAHRLVDAVTVTVHKPQAPVGVEFGDVEVSVTRRRDPVPVVIALGANLGDREQTLAEALGRIELLGVTDVLVSEHWETDPVGGPDQPPYLNLVLTGRVRLSAPALLRALHGIEADLGRVREVRWGARTVDLDLIQYGTPGGPDEWVSSGPALVLPHPRAHERAFVLVPWLEVDPDAWLRVGDGMLPVRDLVEGMDTSGVRAYESVWDDEDEPGFGGEP